MCVCPCVTDVTSLPQHALWERGHKVYSNAYSGNESRLRYNKRVDFLGTANHVEMVDMVIFIAP